MEKVLGEELQRLGRMPIAQLRARYREVYGEEARSGHQQHLVRRIGWRLQVLAQGDLSERAARRAQELARDADLKTQAPAGWVDEHRIVCADPRFCLWSRDCSTTKAPT